MKSPKNLSDHELDLRLGALVEREREALHEVLLHIQEVAIRKIYLKRAYPSLFEYLTRELGYSPASAQRRIDAIRFAEEEPAVLEKVKEGDVTLSQISLIQKATRLTEREVTPELKSELLQQVQGLSMPETERIIADALDVKVGERATYTEHGAGTVRLHVTLTREQWDKLERCRALLAHQNPGGGMEGVLILLCRFYLKKKDPLWEEPVRRNATSAAEVAVQQTH